MNNIALIISTHDNSNDLWETLEQTYHRFWKDIKFPIYLTTNHKVFKSKIFNSLKVGDELSWSDNLIKSLNKIEQDFVLLTFDDLFLVNKVNNQFIEELTSRAIKEKFNYLQFYCSISKGRRIDNLIFKKNNKTIYKNSTIWSFWNKKILIELLRKEESAWQFEQSGNKRSFDYDHFYSTRENVIPFANGVVKGVWNPLVKNKLHKLNFSTSSIRPSLGFAKTLIYKLRDLQFDFFSYIIHKLY